MCSVFAPMPSNIFLELNKISIEQIDFGDEEKDYGNEIDFGDTDNAAEIDWGNNQIIQGHDNKSPDDSRITIESSGLAGGVARKENAFTVLDSPSYRELFLDELFEVHFTINIFVIVIKETYIRSDVLNSWNHF